MRKLLGLLGVEHGEERLVGLLWAHSFLMGVGLYLFQTSAEAMLVARYGAQGLPYIYIGWAIAVPAAGLAYARLQRRLAVGPLWTTALGFSVALIAGMAVLLKVSDAAWPVFVVNVATDVLWALVGLEFWGFAGSVLDLRQAKRLFGLIGSGEVASALIAGAAVGPLLAVLDVYRLFALSAVALAACLGILVSLLRRHGAALAPEEEDEAGPGRGGLLAVAREPYVQLLIALFFLSMLTFDLLEYVYLDQAGARYGTDARALATFIGSALAVRQGATLLLKTAVSGRVLGRYGLGLGLTAQPVWQLAGLTVVLVTSALRAGTGLLFWLVVVVVVLDRVVRKAVSKPAEQLLYQPLSRDRRLAAHTLMESFVEPITTGACGAALLGLTTLLKGRPAETRALTVAGVTLGIVAVWLGLTRVLRPRYTATLAKALVKRDLGEAALSLDEDAVAWLEGGLVGRPAGEAIYILDLLRKACPRERFERHLASLLDSPAPQVRRHVLELAGELRVPGLLGALAARLGKESDDDVLGALLPALAATGEPDAIELVAPFLHDPRTPVRRAAMVALVKHGGLEGFLAAAEALSALLRSRDAAERALAAEVLGEVGARGFYRTLLKLLADPDLAVRRAALGAAVTVHDPALWPAVAECLRVAALRPAATSALIAAGEEAVPEIERLTAAASTPRAVLLRAIYVAARLPGSRATALLLSRIGHPDPEVRHQVLEALRHRHHRAGRGERGAVEERVRAEVRNAAAVAAARADLAGLADAPDAGLLRAALDAELARCRDLVLLLLSLLHPGPELLDARRSLRDGAPQKRAYAVEVVDSLCPGPLKPLVVPLVEERSPEALLVKLGDLAPAPSLGATERLVKLCEGGAPWLTPWTRSCAAHLAGARGLGALAEALRAGLLDPDAGVREASLWSLSRIQPSASARLAEDAVLDPAPAVSRLARSLSGPRSTEGA